MSEAEKMFEAGRVYNKGIPYDTFVQMGKRYFPHLGSRAAQGDKEAMMGLFESFSDVLFKGKKLVLDGEPLNLDTNNTELAQVLWGTAVFWFDKSFE